MTDADYVSGDPVFADFSHFMFIGGFVTRRWGLFPIPICVPGGNE